MNEPRKQYIKDYQRDYSTRKKRISITVDNAEYQALSHIAERENKKLAVLVKEYAFASLSNTLAIPKDIQTELQTLSLLVRNIANNINQIARHANRSESLLANDSEVVLKHLKSLEEQVIDYTKSRLKGHKSDED